MTIQRLLAGAPAVLVANPTAHSGKAADWIRHARALLGQPDPEAMARDIIEQGLNVRQVEALAQEQSERPQKNMKSRTRGRKHADVAALERRLTDALGLAVDIEHRGKGGVLRIRYRDVEQLDEVVRRLEHG